MLEVIIGIIIGIVLTLAVLVVLARRHYVKNFKSVGIDLKSIFKDDSDFDFKEADFEE